MLEMCFSTETVFVINRFLRKRPLRLGVSARSRQRTEEEKEELLGSKVSWLPWLRYAGCCLARCDEMRFALRKMFQLFIFVN